MKCSVYAISSLVKNYIYVGLAYNVTRRVAQHNAGKETTTRSYLPFELIYTEEFPDRKTARNHEKYLKSGIGKEFLRTIRRRGEIGRHISFRS